MAAEQHHDPHVASVVLDPVQKTIVMIALMLALLLQVLDTTIANVALPHMMASMSATQESINWVLTSYIIASAIAIPITGWLSDRVGRRPLFIGSVVAFTVASVLCAMAQNLSEMVVFRALQGVSGALLVPISQSTMLDINPPAKHAQAMAVFGLGVMVGPILGPVLGGWLTENYNWRWVFLVNLPFGIICTLILLRYMPSSPTAKRRFDLFGFALLAIALACLQLMLDRGQQLDWFDSWEIRVEAGLAASCFWMFTVHSMTAKAPLFDPDLVRHRNFAFGVVLMFFTSIVLMGGLALLPPLLQHVYGYSVMDSGMLMVPRSVGTVITMMIAGRLTGRMDPRILMGTGIAIMAVAAWQMSGFSIIMDSHPIISTGFVQGLGMGLMFVPLQTTAFGALAPAQRTTGAALYNLSRNVGGSVGISVMTFLLARNVQQSHSDLAQHFTWSNLPALDPSILNRLGATTDTIVAMMDAEINRQALMIAFLDDFRLMAWIAVLSLPLALLLKRPKLLAAGDAPMPAME